MSTLSEQLWAWNTAALQQEPDRMARIPWRVTERLAKEAEALEARVDLLADLDVEPWAIYAEQLDRILASGLGNEVQRTALTMIAEACRTAGRLLRQAGMEPKTWGTQSRDKTAPHRNIPDEADPFNAEFFHAE